MLNQNPDFPQYANKDRITTNAEGMHNLIIRGMQSLARAFESFRTDIRRCEDSSFSLFYKCFSRHIRCIYI